LARACVNARDYAAAVVNARRALSLRPGYAPAHLILAIALALDGQLDAAVAALDECERCSPGLIERRLNWSPYTNAKSNEHLRAGLKMAQEARAGLLRKTGNA
jgi:uncharacterized membrane-anchored protein